MALVFLILYFAFLTVVAGFALLWSGWPEKHGGSVLAMKKRLPPVLQLWHPKQVIPIFVFCGVLLLVFTWLEYKGLM